MRKKTSRLSRIFGVSRISGISTLLKLAKILASAGEAPFQPSNDIIIVMRKVISPSFFPL